jgi:hypothetical protein
LQATPILLPQRKTLLEGRGEGRWLRGEVDTAGDGHRINQCSA